MACPECRKHSWPRSLYCPKCGAELPVPGRGRRCFCGSGRPFEACCLEQVRAAAALIAENAGSGALDRGGAALKGFDAWARLHDRKP